MTLSHCVGPEGQHFLLGCGASKFLDFEFLTIVFVMSADWKKYPAYFAFIKVKV